MIAASLLAGATLVAIGGPAPANAQSSPSETVRVKVLA
jgi:hypothetical protein